MRRGIIIFIALALFLASGCNRAVKSDSLNKEVVPLQGFQDTEYNAETDYQFFFDDNADIVLVGDGYYALKYGLLYYMDKSTMEKVFVCTNLDCRHDNEDCDAYLGNASFLQYCDGSLYYVVCGSGKCTICKRTLDGSVVSKICSINIDGIIPNISTHRGYAYYYLFEGDDKCSLFRVKLEADSTPEKLYTCKGYGAQIYKIHGYGDGVSFTTSIALDKDYNSFRQDIFYYDANENVVMSILEDTSSSCVIVDDKVYYWHEDGVYCYEPESGSSELFYELDEPSFVSFDGENFYFDNKYGINLKYLDAKEHRVYAVKREGELIDTIGLPESICLYGDSYYLFQSADGGVKIFDKSQFGTGEYKWNYMVFKALHSFD